MMKKQLITLVVSFIAIQAVFSQTVAKSILAEYGYVNIPKEDVALHTMFGITKYRLYADDKYLKIESYQDLTEEEIKKVGPTLRSAFIKERRTGQVFPCISMGDLHIRMKGGEKEQASFQQMVESFNSDSAGIHGAGLKKINVLDFECTELLVRGKFSDTISAYICKNIELDPSIKDFPLYVAQKGVKYGLMMGRDEILWDGKLVEFRAEKLIFNQPVNIAAELASYELVSEQEGEKRLKAAFAKMMERKD